MSGKPYLSLTAARIDPATITIDHAGRDLDEGEAWALAELVKRLGWVECKANAVEDAEAHLMMEALGKLQTVLARAGLAPR